MPEEAYCLFDTAFGVCGIAWSRRGLTAVQLPEAARAATRARLERRGAHATNPPPEIVEAVDSLRAYFAGDPVEFADVAVDPSGNADRTRRKIYDVVRALRWGETATYGEVARRAGLPGGARQVGQAMAKNPLPIIIPCHRVLAAGGRIGGFSAYGGALTKERLLALERLRLPLDG
jgi:methylated-DNA-[protein]-cysteine S-methyltransferase